MKTESWQRLSEADSDFPTVLVFPPTGAGAPAFQAMSVLKGAATVWAYCPPGRGRRLFEDGIRTMDDFLSQTTSSVEIPPGPLVLAGVSFGAALAFATTNALESRDVVVSKLIALCSTSPSSYTAEPADWDMESARRRMINYGLTPADVLELDDADTIFVRPTLDDLLLADSYDGAHAGPVMAPVTCVSASDDKIVPATEAARWRDATSTTYNFIEVTGGHYAHAAFGREDWLNVLA